MDAKTVTNYCDGVQFNKVTYTTSYLTDGDIKNIYLRFKPAITFFDNYKMTVNINEFGYTATDISTESNSTIVNFDDTMVLADGDLIFTDPDGNEATATVEFISTHRNAIPKVGDELAISRGLTGMVAHPNRNLIGLGGGAAVIGGLLLFMFWLTWLSLRRKRQ
jgi:hypothetical protein